MRKFIVLLMCLPIAVAAPAGEAGQAGQVMPWIRSGWWPFLAETFRSLDAVGFALIVLLLILAAMCLDLLHHLRIARLIPEKLLAEVQENMANGEYERALETCEKSDCLIGDIFAAALGKTDYSFLRMEEALRAEARIQGMVWRQWVRQFRTAAAVGFLLGLMGAAVNGMRFIFELGGQEIPPGGLLLASPGVRLLGYNILASFFLGCLMTLVSLAAYAVCSSKLEKILLEADRLGEELLDPFRPLPQEE